MDNLKDQIIEQYEFKIEGYTFIITAMLDKKTSMLEYYGHIKGYGTILFLLGYDATVLGIKKDDFDNEIKNYAKVLAHDYAGLILERNGIEHYD